MLQWHSDIATCWLLWPFTWFYELCFCSIFMVVDGVCILFSCVMLNRLMQHENSWFWFWSWQKSFVYISAFWVGCITWYGITEFPRQMSETQLRPISYARCSDADLCETYCFADVDIFIELFLQSKTMEGDGSLESYHSDSCSRLPMPNIDDNNRCNHFTYCINYSCSLVHKLSVVFRCYWTLLV